MITTTLAHPEDQYLIVLRSDGSEHRGDPLIARRYLIQLGSALDKSSAELFAYLESPDLHSPEGTDLTVIVSRDGSIDILAHADPSAAISGVDLLANVIPMLSMIAPMIANMGQNESE